MKKNLPLLLCILSVLLTGCIKNLEKEGIFMTTKCHGMLIEQRTNQPVCGMRIMLTNGDKIPVYAVSSMDGSFEIEVTAEQVSQKYYLHITADSLYEEKQVSLQEVGYGKQNFDLGTIYIVGPDVPVVTTAAVTDIDAVSAHGGGEVLDGGKSSVSSRGLCWSTHQYPTISDARTVNGNGLGLFQGEMTGLQVGTVYYVRAYATNGVGTGYGEQRSFTTLSGLPTVNTGVLSGIQPTSAVCSGTVVADGGFAVTARGVCWSTVPQPIVANAHTTNGAGLGDFIGNLTGLQPSTTYYVRAYATNANGTAYGEQRLLITAMGLPVVTTAQVTSIACGTATCGGVVQSDGGFTVTARGVCYSSTPNPSLSGPHTSDGTGLGAFVSQLTGLVAGTTYYVRAYATNGVGTVYGEDKVFVGE